MTLFLLTLLAATITVFMLFVLVFTIVTLYDEHVESLMVTAFTIAGIAIFYGLLKPYVAQLLK